MEIEKLNLLLNKIYNLIGTVGRKREEKKTIMSQT